MSSGAGVTRGAGPSSAATAARDNLPEPLTRFIGREGVVEELQGLWRNHACSRSPVMAASARRGSRSSLQRRCGMPSPMGSGSST